MERFKAFRIHDQDGAVAARVEDIGLEDLAAGEVVVAVSYSDVNYKDALAATGAGKILRRFPLVGGIDLAGEVVSSTDERYEPGQRVLVTGCGLSETHDGGYAEFARMRGEWVIPIPEGLCEHEAMCLGTAGFTAALAIHRLEHNGQAPEAGPVVVTGATGGVGSLAVDMLSALGYEVVAVSGKAKAGDYLRQLGAARVLLRQELELGSRPLEKVLWAGAIDNVGGELLGWLTRTVGFWGNIASIGLAGGAELRTTVMPFILRGVNLLGINSVATPRELRLKVWERLAKELKPPHLDLITTRTIGLEQLPEVFQDYLEGSVTGRTVVKVG